MTGEAAGSLVAFVEDLLDEWADLLDFFIPGLDYIPDPDEPTPEERVSQKRAAWQAIKPIEPKATT